MNGLIKIVADTNVFFMAFYNIKNKASALLNAAIEGKVVIFSPDTVREELKRVLIRELDFTEDMTESSITHLPAIWVGKEVYESCMEKASIIKHKPDRPVLAVALALNCGIITADFKDFKPAKKLVKLWNIDELLKAVS